MQAGAGNDKHSAYGDIKPNAYKQGAAIEKAVEKNGRSR
jgi:hypothetical protein